MRSGSIRGRSAFRLSVAAIIGAAAGYGSILFRYLIDLVNQFAFPGGIGLTELTQTPYARIIIAPAIGGLIVSPLVYFLAREARGHGVPEVKDACTNRGGRIRSRVAVVKTIASAITVGTGGSAGREGPIIQIGSAIGSAVGRSLGLSGQFLIDMVASGAAAGMAATFNAPIAGVLFALEIILERSSARHFSPLIVSTVIATVVARHHLGDVPAFRVPHYSLASGWELPLYVLLGIAAALVGVAFTRGLSSLEDAWDRLPIPAYAHGVLGGAIVGGMAIWRPELLGVGYSHIEAVLGYTHAVEYAQHGIGSLLFLVALKIVATGTTIGSGGSGGVFAPSLFLGATLGGAFGRATNRIFPHHLFSGPGAYALVSMGAVVAATTHAPLTAILIVFELTDGYTIILPLMLSCILSAMLAMRLFEGSIYTARLLRRGRTTGGSSIEEELVAKTRVRTLMDPSVATIRPNTALIAIVERAVDLGQSCLYVTDRKKHLLGEVTVEDVALHVHDDERKRRKLVADDLAHPVFAQLKLEDPLQRCLELLNSQDTEQLPVVDSDNRLKGRVTRADVLSFMSREILRHEAVFSFVRDKENEASRRELVRLPTGEVKAIVPVTKSLADRSLRDLNMRVKYGINVYAVRHDDGHTTMPIANEKLHEGDSLLVVGPTAEVEHVKDIAATQSSKDSDKSS